MTGGLLNGIADENISLPPVARKSLVTTVTISSSVTSAPLGLARTTFRDGPSHVAATVTPDNWMTPFVSCRLRAMTSRSAAPGIFTTASRLSNGMTS